MPTVQALIDNLIAEFTTLDQQLKVNYCHQQIHQNYPDLAEKAHLKVGVGQLNPTLVIILLYP